MVRGKIYRNQAGMVVMCTKIDSSKYFEGVVLSSELQDDVVGIHSKFMQKSDYTENIGPISLNNVHIKE